jgi:hypothetical protein
MSALPPKADILWCAAHVRFVPEADIVKLRLIMARSPATDCCRPLITTGD